MGIFQFFRILWARKVIVLATMICTFLGAYVVTLIAAPRYEARARVMLNVLRADPVTGQTLGLRAVGTYVATQIEVMKDYGTTGPVVDALGWLSDPNLIASYSARPASDTRDFRRWLAQRLADRISAKLVAGSILEITFSSPNPVEARLGAETLRQAYMDSSLTARRRDASKMAAWYTSQADLARKAAERAEQVKASYERESGIVMQDQTDLDSDRLRSLANQAAVVTTPPMPYPTSSAASLQLAQIEAQIAQLSRSLGPNHPEMQELRARRDSIAKIAQEEVAALRANANAAAASVGAAERALEAQKSRVIAQRDKVERLRQLQAEVDLRREQYRKTASRAAELSLESSIADTGMTALGVVVTPSRPAFPDKQLIMGGALALGTSFGLGLALLVELLRRRVRGIEDLNGSLDVPCLGIVEGARKPNLFRRLLRRRTRLEPIARLQPS